MMKLAEALAERSDIRKKLDSLSGRLNNNVRVLEGEEPTEDPKRLLKDLNVLIAREEELIRMIDIANANTVAANGEPLAALLARRKALMDKVEILENLMRSAENSRNSYASKDSLREIVTVNIPSLRKEADALSKEIRETDSLIQMTNWSTDI